MHQDGLSVMFPLGSQEVSGLATSDPSHPNDPVGIDLTPTPILYHTPSLMRQGGSNLLL